MVTTANGPARVFLAGSVVNVDDETAALWVEGGYATAVPAPADNTPPSGDQPPAEAPAPKKAASAKAPTGSPQG